ncbi:zinc ribbon domain-containing protein [Niveibacterium sp. 24ML]|uniref:FmdB family zinc ribbon protein n=1 Tax=Niveibacterium sp. 24ML TaxID=2985512 RepID=UPI00226F6FBF|nr:zinc ribbon domain-containing protein [Niveibacterium sp. 24ML]MCX9156838.1 zinc ribbon domain-containing protein [Niveibacterium sp. 24ML]
MPIYEYRCSDCGFQKDVLQKISDAALTVCPSCGKETFGKALTAAGFQLKGSGWYATDFKGGASSAAAAKPAESAATEAAKPAGCGGNCACH